MNKKNFEIPLEDLFSESIITLPIPKECDNTVSIFFKSHIVYVKFNTDFVEKYEKRLIDSEYEMTVGEAIHYKPESV